MKKLFIILIGCMSFAAVHAQMDNPLKKGMPNTLALPSGEVVYDLNGEWEAVYHDFFFGFKKDIVKIKQEGNKFVGSCIIGNQMAQKGSETIKGELVKDGFKSAFTYYNNLDWYPSTGEIGGKCNKIVIRTRTSTGGMMLLLTLTRK
jgi:hypothetical protein